MYKYYIVLLKNKFVKKNEYICNKKNEYMGNPFSSQYVENRLN